MVVFGKPNQNQNATPPPKRRAADVARIQGGGLVQVIITSVQPLIFYLFLNDKAVSQMDVDSLTLSIDAPSEEIPSGGVYATLVFRATNVTGEKTAQSISLFPSTIEIVGAGRRITVTAKNPDSV